MNFLDKGNDISMSRVSIILWSFSRNHNICLGHTLIT